LAILLEQVPDVNVIIDHMADCLNGNRDDFQKLIALARYSRVFLKIGHIPNNSSETFPWHDTHDPMEQVCQAYGAHRIMWGSDWPLSLSFMTYAQSISYVHELEFLTQEDREWILGKTALQFWPIETIRQSSTVAA